MISITEFVLLKLAKDNPSQDTKEFGEVLYVFKSIYNLSWYNTREILKRIKLNYYLAKKYVELVEETKLHIFDTDLAILFGKSLPQKRKDELRRIAERIRNEIVRDPKLTKELLRDELLNKNIKWK
jgi:hypothetical protein